MKTQIIFSDDYKTGEVYDFSRVAEILEGLPEGDLRTKLLSNMAHCERTLMRILRNTSKRLEEMLRQENGGEFRRVPDGESYSLHVFPDGRGLDSLSFCFAFMFNNGKEEKRDMNGGIIFHGVHKLFNKDLSQKTDVNWDNEGLASIQIHT